MPSAAEHLPVQENDPAYDTLFRPFRLGNLELPNRIVMAPMTRKFSPSGVPGTNVAEYYRRRAEGGVGLIVTEGIYVHTSAGPEHCVPNLHHDSSVEGWRSIVETVHAAGGLIAAQLWHVGVTPLTGPTVDPDIRLVGPSGLTGKAEPHTEPMSLADIEETIEAYGDCAEAAKRVGFNGIEIHAAHGYLIDQFFWERTNRRDDHYGGDYLERMRFGIEVLQECRRRVGPDFPISFRFSQWKIADYAAKLAPSPAELERFLAPLVDAGVTVFHCSTRRFWEPEFPGSDLNLAGWTKKLTGLPTITVGSVTLSTDIMDRSAPAMPTDLSRLIEMMERGDFDLVAVGRAIIANPEWPKIIRRGALHELVPFVRAEADKTLI